jgi:predicted nucleotidyltransferase
MSENFKNILSSLAQEFGVKKLVLFGSALNSFEEARDIDFACEGINNKNFFRFGAKLEEFFNKRS